MRVAVEARRAEDEVRGDGPPRHCKRLQQRARAGGELAEPGVEHLRQRDARGGGALARQGVPGQLLDEERASARLAHDGFDEMLGPRHLTREQRAGQVARLVPGQGLDFNRVIVSGPGPREHLFSETASIRSPRCGSWR